MSVILRLAIAGGLGVVAALLNAWSLSDRGASVVAFTRDVKPGATIAAADLGELVMGGDAAALRRAFLPWGDRVLVEGMVAPRGFAAGDPVLQRDLREADGIAEHDFDLVRFRVIAVGNRFKRPVGDEAATPGMERGSTVTVAVKEVKGSGPHVTDGPQRDAQRLLGIVARIAADGAERDGRILGVVVYPPESGAVEDTTVQGALGLKDDEMAITVPLDGVESVPEVILVGGEIGFFLRPEYP